MSINKMFFTLLISIFSATALANADIYIYPNKGQSPEQQSRDRYECHVWAAQQSGFDPSTYSASATSPVHVASTTGGPYRRHRGDLDPIRGAAGGAALGALGGAIGGDAGKGAAIGAGVGALAGIFSSANKHQQAKNRHATARAQQAAQQAQQQAQLVTDQANYRRAMSACLEAHAYTVR